MKKNKNIFRSPGYTKPSVQSVTFLRRLSRLPASHPALPGISRCKTRRELKLPRCGNAHISSNTLAYAGAGWLLPLLLRGLYLLHIQYAGFFVFGTLFLNFFYFFVYCKIGKLKKVSDMDSRIMYCKKKKAPVELSTRAF